MVGGLFLTVCVTIPGFFFEAGPKKPYNKITTSSKWLKKALLVVPCAIWHCRKQLPRDPPNQVIPIQNNEDTSENFLFLPWFFGREDDPIDLALPQAKQFGIETRRHKKKSIPERKRLIPFRQAHADDDLRARDRNRCTTSRTRSTIADDTDRPVSGSTVSPTSPSSSRHSQHDSELSTKNRHRRHCVKNSPSLTSFNFFRAANSSSSMTSSPASSCSSRSRSFSSIIARISSISFLATFTERDKLCADFFFSLSVALFSVSIRCISLPFSRLNSSKASSFEGGVEGLGTSPPFSSPSVSSAMFPGMSATDGASEWS